MALRSEVIRPGHWEIEGWTVRRDEATGKWKIGKFDQVTTEVSTLGDARVWIAEDLDRITPPAEDSRLPFDTLAIPNDREEGEYTTFGDARFLRMHGCTDPVPVRLVEDPDGKYLTWLSYEDGEREPIFTLWATIFDVQFPYGHEAEEKAGKGRAVRVRVERR